jgi:capsular polysaccharide transport system ATP-binding protein
MIEVRNVWKRYHTFKASDWVLRDIDLVIPRDISVGVIGRNGAGKSTLLRLIAAMDSPERGQVVRRSRVSWPIGLAGGLQPTMTGRQNVKFVARIHGSGKSIPEVMAKVEDFAEIGDAMDRPIKTYSSGMRARLNLGLSLAFDFDVYLSDEATAVGDAAFRKKAMAAFNERVGQASLIMVSHQEGILKELCQAGVLIDQGHAYWFDDVNEALKAYGEMVRHGSAARAVH